MIRYFLIGFAIMFLFSCVKKKEEIAHERPSVPTNQLHLSDQQMQLGNVLVDTLKEQVLGEELMLTGKLIPDQNNVTSISARIMGRIEKLYFKNSGEEILKGQPIFDIYSEELSLAAKELKLAVKKKRTLNMNGVDLDKLIQSAINKLSLYGLTSGQIKEIETGEGFSNIFTIRSLSAGTLTSIDVKEGDYIMEGGSVYHLADLSTLWAEVQVYSDNIPDISKNMNATVYFPAIPGLKKEGKVSFISPELNPSSKINLMRVEIPNNDKNLMAGMQVNVSLLTGKVKTLALPTDAIILDGKGASVWIKTGHNQFQSIMVKTGIETNEFTEIKSGLNAGNLVVVSGAYLLSSEYIFNTGVDAMSGHSH
jgi:Cu(I)/Ag(I) efflux system membrane fusion protein